MTTPEDDSSTTPPHGDALRDHGTDAGAPASRHGVQLDPRGGGDASATTEEGKATTSDGEGGRAGADRTGGDR